MKIFAAIIIIMSLTTTLSGCGRGPFLMVQTCLGDQHNVDLFIKSIKSISKSEKMEFIDNGLNSQKELSTLKLSPDYKIIDIWVNGNNGVGLSAGNFSLSPYEVVVGFSDGKNHDEVVRFSNLVVKKLSEKWVIHVVPSGQGAFPMRECQKINPGDPTISNKKWANY